MNRLFDKEYIKGKGMKNGGYGGLIVGDYLKHRAAIEEAEKERLKFIKWQADYKKREAAKIKKQKMREEARQRREYLRQMAETALKSKE